MSGILILGISLPLAIFYEWLARRIQALVARNAEPLQHRIPRYLTTFYFIAAALPVVVYAGLGDPLEGIGCSVACFVFLGLAGVVLEFFLRRRRGGAPLKM